MKRVYNFSAGPAVLPEEVLKKVADEMFDYNGRGMSVMEMSHRSKAFERIIDTAERDLRDIMNVPEEYSVIFMQGGATTQFAAVPMNLMTANRKAAYIDTGNFAYKAFEEAVIFSEKARVVASSRKWGYKYIPDCSDLDIHPDDDYVYMCENNTVFGTQFKSLPDAKGRPLVSDQSSCFLSRPINVTDYGVIFAGVQKNVGPSGMAIVIARKDLIKDRTELQFPTPHMLSWQAQADAKSMFNTPNTWSIYVCGLVFKWIKSRGTLADISAANEEKAAILYDCIDNSPLFINDVDRECRSVMNVVFTTGSDDLDEKFITEAKNYGIFSIKGHKRAGGMRASLYNAMPIEGVRALVEFMRKFEKENVR